MLLPDSFGPRGKPDGICTERLDSRNIDDATRRGACGGRGGGCGTSIDDANCPVRPLATPNSDRFFIGYFLFGADALTAARF